MDGPDPSRSDADPCSGLEAVFLENRAALTRFLASHGAGDAAEDLLHELWIRLSAGAASPVAQPLSYLYRAANNLVIDWHRSRRQAHKRNADWSDATGSAWLEASNEPLADRLLVGREALTGAEAALTALGQRVSAVFRMHRLEGVAQREIADRIGVSLSTVESDLRKAYRALVDYRRTLDAPDAQGSDVGQKGPA
jgi:RNA polymerase sigma-70 factor (ECF subfamily)